ncbi:MAG TPA: LysR family transcriptional regulator, partial [Telluria sp.]
MSVASFISPASEVDVSVIKNENGLSYKQYFHAYLLDFLMNPTLRQMRALVALAKTGNFTLAAQYM